jgi:ABC-type dipeptide/oligopeptide/nickel transport system permease component
MGRYIARRCLLVVPTILGVLTLVFFLRFLSPGDPARLMLGERATPEAVKVLRAEWGLDKPKLDQYTRYMGKVFHLDLGNSYKTGDPVIKEILTRFPATVELSIYSILLSSIFGVLAGIVAATKRNTIADYLAMTGSLVGVSIPIFWLGLMLIIVFSVGLNLFPTGGRLDARMLMEPITGLYTLDGILYGFKEHDWSYFFSALHHIVLPAVALATVPLAVIARVTRSAMLEIMGQDYIRTARAKGLSERLVVWRHALKNALLPIITIIGIEFGYNLAGAVLTESIFAWPGIGNFLYNAVLSRDYLAIQGGVAFVSVAFILINLLVDVMYAYVNPRIRY